MPDVQMCQSIVVPERGSGPCANAASEVLHGFYLCAPHANQWQRRWERGEKNRLHPQRLAITTVSEANPRFCPRCKTHRAALAFPISWKPGDWCKPCHREYQRNYHHRVAKTKRSRARSGAEKSTEGKTFPSSEAFPTAAPPISALDSARDQERQPEGKVLEFITPRGSWICDHSPDQTGGKRCIRCCVATALEYVSLRASGGTPARYRWLCPGCLDVYRGLGLVDEVRALFTGGHDPAHFGVVA